MEKFASQAPRHLDKFHHNLRAQASKVYLLLDEFKGARLTDEQLLTYMRTVAMQILEQCQLFEDQQKLAKDLKGDGTP